MKQRDLPVTYEILKLEAAHVTDLKEIERETGISSWRENEYLEEIKRDGSVCLAAVIDGALIGFLIARLITQEEAAEAELLNFAVRLDMHGQGIGASLFGAFRRIAAEAGARKIWLEVRSKNSAAIRFYTRQGFGKAGKRRGYYSDPADDAVVMLLEFE